MGQDRRPGRELTGGGIPRDTQRRQAGGRPRFPQRVSRVGRPARGQPAGPPRLENPPVNHGPTRIEQFHRPERGPCVGAAPLDDHQPHRVTGRDRRLRAVRQPHAYRTPLGGKTRPPITKKSMPARRKCPGWSRLAVKEITRNSDRATSPDLRRPEQPERRPAFWAARREASSPASGGGGCSNCCDLSDRSCQGRQDPGWGASRTPGRKAAAAPLSVQTRRRAARTRRSMTQATGSSCGTCSLR